MDVEIVESISHRTPFGARFLDGVTGTTVREGLAVSLRPQGLAGAPVPAFITASGAYGFEGVSGLNAWEYDESVPFPAGKTYLLLCEDVQGRYLPCSETLGQANLQKPLVTPLYSMPSRLPVPGLLVVRGHLVHVQGAVRTPAAYSKIEAAYAVSPPVYTGLSDARGEFALFLPGPDPQVAAANPAAALPDKTWPLTLTFSYGPATQQYACVRPDGHTEIVIGPSPADLAARRAAGWRCLPDLKSLLTQGASQVFVSLVAKAASLTIQVPFSRSAVAATPQSDDGAVWLSS